MTVCPVCFVELAGGGSWDLRPHPDCKPEPLRDIEDPS